LPKPNVSESLVEIKKKMEQQREEAQKILELELESDKKNKSEITEIDASDNNKTDSLNQNEIDQNTNEMLVRRPIITPKKDPRWNEYIGKTHYFRHDQIEQIEKLVALTGRGKNEIMRLAWDYFYSNILIDN
jgi:hypothetical protein